MRVMADQGGETSIVSVDVETFLQTDSLDML